MIVFSSLRLLLAVMGKFHELGFEPSKLAVIFLLLSQEASAKTISLGLFSLLPCNYPALALQRDPVEPRGCKTPLGKCVFHNPNRQTSPAEKQFKLLSLKRRKIRGLRLITHLAFYARHCTR